MGLRVEVGRGGCAGGGGVGEGVPHLGRLAGAAASCVAFSDVLEDMATSLAATALQPMYTFEFSIRHFESCFESGSSMSSVWS